MTSTTASDWVGALGAAGLTPVREVTWTRDGVERGGAPPAIDVPTPPGSVAVAVVTDQETGAVYVVPADGAVDAPERGSAAAAPGSAGTTRFTLDGGDERGPIGVLARLLAKGPGKKVITIVAGRLAEAAASAWEQRARPERARWFRPRDATGTVAPFTGDDWHRVAQGPSLLWLHGPLVQAGTGFDGLDADLWDRLAQRYEGRSWAYDHHTISTSPRANAEALAALAQAAGSELTIDVMAHSRGGLVARELAERLSGGPLRVRSLVLVGTPNLGTPLADAANLVGWVNRVTNLLTLIPNPVADVADAIVAVLTQVLGAAYDALPGINAMRPVPRGQDRGYLHELNALGRAAATSYRFVGSDHHPDDSSLIGKVFDGWIVDSVLQAAANDLVVPLASTLTAGDSAGDASETLTVHDAVHTEYWRSPEVTAQLRTWLLDAPITATSLPDSSSASESTRADAEPTVAPLPAPTPNGSPAAAASDVAAPPAAAPEVIAGAVAAPDTASSGAAVPDTAATDVTTPAAPEVPVLVGAATEPHLASAADAANLAPGEAAEVPLPPLVVGIRHASLEHSPYPLLIGHFAGAPITGAEARLDERLDGRLSRLQLLGQTPRQIGESILLPPVDDATPPGVVVVGLGPAGELTSTELTAIVTRALLKMLSIQLEQQLEHERLEPSPEGVPPKRRGLGISAVLIGTSSGGGLTVEGSIRGILAGVTTANERLRRVRVDLRGSVRRATDYVHFARLEMVERYADRVDLVAAALTRLQELEAQRVQDRDEEAAATGATGPAPGSGTTTAPASGPREPSVLFVPEPIRGEGASSSNPPLDRAEDVWRRVGIAVESPPGVSAGGPTIAGIDQTAAPPPANPGVDITIGPAPSQLVLRFTSMGRLARAERLISIVEPSIVQPLIDDAISRDADPDVSGTLFELLVPDLLKGELNDGENLHLLLDDTTAPYPWELLAGRADDVNPQVPLALRVGVLRQFLESEDLRHDIRRAAGDSILVVGNPPPGPGFHPLPAAAAEAQGVATLFGGLGGKWNVEAMVWDASGQQVLPADPLSHEPGEHVLHRLMNGDWRIVHIAAHGDITNDPSTTGVILGGQLHLTANVFKRLSVVPDLVFLNACHLGTIAPRDLRGMNRLAASVAESLLRIGTRAVIVAGWAVNDVAADAFARTVYGQLLDGLHLGDAVHAARLAARDAAPHAQTWGAYQCYGDPGFRLVARTPSTKGQPPVTVGELRRRVQRLAASASDQGRGFSPDTDDAKAEHDDELAELADRARELGSSGALAELADVHAELGHLRTAAGLYQEALGQGGRDVPVEAIEQLGNVLVRDAQARVRDDHTPLDDVRPQLDEASEWLGRALVLGETGERLALLASYHKRCAAMAAGEERRSHLDAALEHYAKAEARTDSAYYWNNWLQLYELVALEVGARPDEWRPPEARPLARPSAPASDGLNGTGAGTPLDELPPPPQGATFWDRAGIGDGMVTDAIRSGRLSAAELIDVYQHAFRLRSSARERASVTDHLRDLVDLLPAEHPLRAALMEAASTLSAWTS